VDEEDALLRAECTKNLPPDLVKFSDLLVRRFENKLDKHSRHLEKICQNADHRSKKAVAVAREAKDVAEEAKTMAAAALSATENQGKQLALLQDQVNSLEAGGVSRLCKGTAVKLLPRSAEERVGMIESRFTKLVNEANSVMTFRLGRKKGEATASLADAKRLFEAFFPPMKYSIVQPPNAKFFRVRPLEMKAVSKLNQLSSTIWVDLNAVGWWFAPDKPQDLQKLEARGREFLKEVKSTEEMKKKIGYIDIENGALVKNGKELVPLLFIPSRDGGTWPALGKMLGARIQADQDDWFGMYAVDNLEFDIKWLETAGFSGLAKDIKAIDSKRGSPVSGNNPL
jgi:hypothetical protein